MTLQNVKTCSFCKSPKPLDQFHKNKAKKDGLSGRCIECQRLASRKYYERNRKTVYERTRANRVKQALALIELKKNTPCKDCGGTFHPYAMEFDHREPSGKHFSIGRRGAIVSRKLREELDKCDLVCSNCHKIRTFRRLQQSPRYRLAGVE